jgi:hypothetical protein
MIYIDYSFNIYNIKKSIFKKIELKHILDIYTYLYILKSKMFPTFISIIKDIERDISNIPIESPILIYIGVGTFAGLMTMDDNNQRILEDSNYHQYPLFIRDMKNKIPNIQLYIILIDPIQENPPYMITDRNLHEQFYQTENEDKFKSIDNRITTYVFRKNVTMDIYNSREEDYIINITRDLEYLNKMCIENTLSLLYHDYSGRQVNYLAEYFDSQLNMYLDRIIYGFNSRQDTGCYFDLTTSTIPYRLKHNRQRTTIKFYNVFKYLETKKYYKIDASVVKYDGEFKNIILNQKQFIIDNICTDLNTYGLATMRVIYKKMNGDDEIIIHDYHFNYIKGKEKEQILKLLEQKEYNKIYDILFEYYSKYFKTICCLKNYDLTGKELLKIITSNPNPYLWISEMKKFGITKIVF